MIKNSFAETHSAKKHFQKYLLDSSLRVGGGGEILKKCEIVKKGLINSLSVKVAIMRNQSIDLLSKLVDWFLYDGKFGV